MRRVIKRSKSKSSLVTALSLVIVVFTGVQTYRLIAIVLIVAAALFSLAVRASVNAVNVDYNLWVRRLFISELCLFLLGVLSFRVSQNLFISISQNTTRLIGFAALAGLIGLIGFHYTLFGESTAGRGILIFALAAALPFLQKAFGRNRWDRRLGDLSYPLYLCHISVIAFLWQAAPGYANLFTA